MAQQTFADWIRAQATEDLKEALAQVDYVADRQGGPVDYEEVDRALDQHNWTVEAADFDWGIPPTLQTPYEPAWVEANLEG